jgi:hypothetical protein
MKLFFIVIFVCGVVLSPLFPGEEEEPTAIVTSFSGSVRIERDGESVPLDAMVQLFEDDRIVTGEDGKIVILYPSGKFRSIGVSMSIILSSQESGESVDRSGEERTEGETEVVGEGNGDFEPLFAFNAAAERVGTRKSVRADDTTGIFILCPGNSIILEERPDIVWTTVSDAEEYSVRIQRMSEVIGESTLQDTILPYPEDWIVLERNRSYVLKIEALSGGKSIISKLVRFKVLSEEKTKVIEKEKDAIVEDSPDEVTEHLLLSELYKENRLLALAIGELKKLIEIAPQIPEFHRSLSEVYKDFGLNKESNIELSKFEELTKGEE